MSRPLDGVIVLAAVTNIPGPLAAAELARLGAGVTKIEPESGDPLEASAPEWYAELTADLHVVRLDLRCAQATVLAQAARADLLITSMRPRALQAAGLHWSRTHAAFPRLSHVEIVGEGGERADGAGHDLTYQAVAGLLTPPAMPRTVFADMFAAERAIAAALRALYVRERTGLSTHAEIAIADGARTLGAAYAHGLTSAGGPLSGAFAGYGLYRTADGWIALAALERHFQDRVVASLGVASLERPVLEQRFAERSTAYWQEKALQDDLPLAAIE